MSVQTDGGALRRGPGSISRWLVVYLAVLTGQDSDSIDLSQQIADFDLDSLDAVELAAQFEKTFGHELDVELFLQGAKSLGDVVTAMAETVAFG